MENENTPSENVTLPAEEIIAPEYDSIVSDIAQLLESARRQAARSVNALMTATYWLIGQHIIGLEQNGKERARRGDSLLERLSKDLTAKAGRGFSVDNLESMRLFYLAYPAPPYSETVSRNMELTQIAERFPLSWSHYVLLIRRPRSIEARTFYEIEAQRGGWSLRQLERQMNSMFYERTALSINKAAMLTKGMEVKPEDVMSAEAEIKDPYVLEFLNLKDDYSELELEEALIKHLESFLLELGNDFAYVARQKRIQIGHSWFRMDLLLYHRRLRCLVIIDLKTGEFNHADAGQMNLYVNYAAEHLTLPDENPPIGLILCSEPNAAVAQYALNGLHNAVLTAEYRLALPDEQLLTAELERTRKLLEQHKKPDVC